MGEETNSFALANMACVGAPDIEAAVVFWGASHIPALKVVGCVRLTAVWGFLYDCKDSLGGQWDSIEFTDTL